MFKLFLNDPKREIEVYDWTSLVGDIGGSLGLFLGFSLLTVWDWVCGLTRQLGSFRYFKTGFY